MVRMMHLRSSLLLSLSFFVTVHLKWMRVFDLAQKGREREREREREWRPTIWINANPSVRGVQHPPN
jgi:hypothetical protein